ncbi:Calcium-dependent lipid-binding (CaLB domain) family protein [Striga hermonthica]|uniref:Calcium-dependent lipid-binding (CaLB domain) family protein n=1 Tax=Striga hermonthica TaxID=68872 RepID=A0A9N7MHP9_STRHE|nr:Calcium-dependent lipid-binding (CaLB domain) family protein [Striga hermonthica]
MDSIAKAARFTYNPETIQESEQSISGILQVYVRNICIHDNQDVYAKFSFTYNPDETFSTRIINGGRGRNPGFNINERLIMKIRQADAVLKCEIWNHQLLGFALIPISSVSGKGKVTRTFDLSSTDLFHSPAGTIKLSLSLDAESLTTNFPEDISLSELVVDSCQVATELLIDKNVPDTNVVNENKQTGSEYFEKNGQAFMRPWPDGSFLHLGSLPAQDHEMADSSSHEWQAGSVSFDGSMRNSSSPPSSTMTSLSNDWASADSIEKKGGFFAEERDRKEMGNEAEGSDMQKQIVDMYMKSMQQFTESLAKMKLPVDLDKPIIIDGPRNSILDADKKIEMEKEKREIHGRVFYGSRAFF